MGERPLRALRMLMRVAQIAILAMTPALANSVAIAAPAKVSPELVVLYEDYGNARQRNPLLRISEDRVLIDAAASGDVRALESDLVALGMRHVAVFGRLVSGELPIVAIPVLSTLDSLAFARPSVARRS